MVRDRSKQQHPKTADQGHINWFATADSQAAHVLDWDIRTDTFWEAVAGVLSAGNAVMLGMSSTGDAMHVTIYVGEGKQRKWVSDSVELDDLMKVIAQQGQTLRRGHIPARLQAIGD